MNVKLLVACFVGTATLLAGPSVMGQDYTGSVLYPLTMPSGFSSGGPGAVSAGQAVGYGSGSATGGESHALLWTGMAAGAVDLNPTNLSGINDSWANGTNGTEQVGAGDWGNTTHALLWAGTAASAVDLNPSGLINTQALATNGTQQVGYGSGFTTNGSYQHALLWTGTAASAIDLNPQYLGISDSYSVASGTNGIQQVGYGYNPEWPSWEGYHALLWSGTAASAVDLNPTDLGGFSFLGSWALAINGTQQVGYGYSSGTYYDHALLWTGTAASAVDLNPTDLSGINRSYANATNGAEQVGYGDGFGTGGYEHALLWTGTADSAVDLETMLPSTGTWTDSSAYTVDSSGDVYGTADGTFDNVTGTFAVEWSSVVPEPPAIGLLGFALLLFRYRLIESANRAPQQSESSVRGLGGAASGQRTRLR